jgi:pimeloyl-ACP methyl ester carboxylesterase
MESKFIDINGVSLNYGEGQLNGPTLVFLHGFPGAWTEHGPVYELLEPYYHVIAPTPRVRPVTMVGFLFDPTVD